MYAIYFAQYMLEPSWHGIRTHNLSYTSRVI